MSKTTLLAGNAIWNTLERFSTMGIQLLCTFVLALFLTPADFGLVGMLVVFTLIGNTITESGFSQALIRQKECSQLTLSSVFWTNLVLSLLVYAVLFGLAPLIASWYHQPLLTSVSRLTFCVIPLGALSLIHITLCTRRLQFRLMCLISLAASLLSCVFAVVWAWHTHSVWALVWQNVLACALRTLGYWITSRWRPMLCYSLAEVRRLFSFSRNLLVTGLIGNLFNNIYTLLIGRCYGATQAGYFVQADRIRIVTSASATQVVQSVSYPILSQIHNDDDAGADATDARLRSAYRRVIGVTLMLVGFGMALLMTVSEDLMQLLMQRPEWRISGRYLYALGVAGILFPLHAVNQNILLVKGLGRTIFWLEVGRRSLMVAILLVAIRFDVSVFVWSYAFYSFLLIFVNLWVCGRPIRYGLRAQLRDIMPTLLSLAAMLVVAQVSNHYLAPAPILMRAVITLLLSAVFGLALLSRLPAFTEVRQLLASASRAFRNPPMPRP